MAVILVLALVAVVLPGLPAAAVDVRTTSTSRILGELRAERLDLRVDGRQVRGDLLRIPKDAPDLELRPRLARGAAAGLQTMTSLSAAQRSRGGIAGVNGGYWLPRPTGVPNGLYVERGRMVAADSALRSGVPAGRAVAGIRADGTLVADRVDVQLTLSIPEAGIVDLEVDEFNRQVRTSTDGTLPRGGELLLFDRRYGTSFEVPAGGLLLELDDLSLGSSGSTTTRVRDRRPSFGGSRWTLTEDTAALLAYGVSTPLLDGVEAGMEATVTTRVTPRNIGASNFAELQSAVPGAGLLIRRGRISIGPALADERISHTYHRRARTAIGQTEDGTTLLLTIDEGAGWSGGVTLHELALIMDRLGAFNAVAMDGGGSTHMTIDGRTRNRPSDPNRGQSSGWFVFGELPPTSRAADGACPTTVPAAGFVDTAHSVHAGTIDCLAWWGVTSGVTRTTYVPAGEVTRAQMASFLARWVDDVATRGDGAVLAAAADLPFVDVPRDDVHAPAIARLAGAGIINGRSATIYDPRAPVTRAETAALLQRSIEYATGQSLPAARDTFIDDNGSVHEDAIDRLAHQGIIGGVGGFAFEPDTPVSRAAMASLVMRASDLLVEQERVNAPA